MTPAPLRSGLSMALCLLASWPSGAALADDADDRLQPGRPALHYLAAHFAAGVGNQAPRELRCPVLGDVEKTKVAIFAKEANEQTMHLAAALDRAMQQYPQLRYSFLLVSEETPGVSMSDEQLAARLDDLRILAEKYDIVELSMACLQPTDQITRWRTKLGFFGDADMVVAVIEPGIAVPSGYQNQVRRGWAPTRKVKPYYRFAERLNSTDIDRDSAEAAIAKAIGSLVEPAPIGLDPDGVPNAAP